MPRKWHIAVLFRIVPYLLPPHFLHPCVRQTKASGTFQLILKHVKSKYIRGKDTSQSFSPLWWFLTGLVGHLFQNRSSWDMWSTTYSLQWYSTLCHFRSRLFNSLFFSVAYVEQFTVSVPEKITLKDHLLPYKSSQPLRASGEGLLCLPPTTEIWLTATGQGLHRHIP